jgi:type I restriction enzyme, S subunit
MKKGWERKKLGEVCAFDKAQGIHRGLPYVGLEHIESHSARFIGSTAPQSVRSSTFRFSHEHVLYGRLRPYLNKALAPDFEGHCSTEIFPLKPCRELSREYLLYWLLSDATCECINATCTGARMPRAQMNEVLAFDFPLPPLAEQRRIVGILDEAFAGLATAQAHAEKNLQNARALFESHLNNVFSKKGEGWVERRLGEVCEIKGRIGFRGYTRQDLVEEGEGAITLSPSNIRNNQFNTDQCTYISWFKYEESPEIMVFEGDILFVKTGSTYGKVALVDKLPELATINPQFVVLKQIKCDNRFLYYSLTTTSFRAQVERIVGGAATPTLSQANLAEQSVPNPPLQEQIRIAARLDALSAETRRLAAVYERKLAALGALKKSLLHRAFAGEL